MCIRDRSIGNTLAGSIGNTLAICTHVKSCFISRGLVALRIDLSTSWIERNDLYTPSEASDPGEDIREGFIRSNNTLFGFWKSDGAIISDYLPTTLTTFERDVYKRQVEGCWPHCQPRKGEVRPEPNFFSGPPDFP